MDHPGSEQRHAVSSCDLHMHTLYSDGALSPQALVQQAAGIGLTTVAITDHDNTRGSREAQAPAAELGLRLIPGIEFSTRWDGYRWAEWGDEIDLLAYFVDWDHPEFRALEQAMLGDYLDQIAQAVEWLNQRGYPVTWQEVKALHPAYPNVNDVVDVLKTKELPEDQSALFRAVADGWNAVSAFNFNISRVIDVVHAAGGVAVLAHPIVISSPAGAWITERDLAQLVEFGLDGIEIFHPLVAPGAPRDYFLGLARHFDLAISGGSDEHGRPASCRRLGQQPITEEIVSGLQARRRT
jgi:predicted metal-dependent phosphoesterase TrpH